MNDDKKELNIHPLDKLAKNDDFVEWLADTVNGLGLLDVFQDAGVRAAAKGLFNAFVLNPDISEKRKQKFERAVMERYRKTQT